MKHMQIKIISIFVVFLLTTFMLSSCSSDSSSADAVPVPTVTGTAAAGLPIVGIVNIKGAEGNTASADIDTDGNYSLNVTGLTAPYILWAQGTVNGESVELYSTGVGEGNINITPITNLIASKVFTNLDTAFDNWAAESTTVDEAAIEAAETAVQTQLAPILEAYGITAEIDLMSVDFDTDHSGLDAVLDIVEINIDDSNNVTITNTATGTTVTGDTTFDSTEGTALVQIISETAAMNVVWTTLNNLIATSSPTASQINSVLAPLMADDMLNEGKTKAVTISDWVTYGLPVGGTFAMSIESPMEASEFSGSYTKGYWIKVYIRYEGVDYLEKNSMVYNGTNWLLHGNREWVDTWFRFAATKRVSIDGTITYTSDIFHNVYDNTNYAYDQGVRYALIRGPGLPIVSGENRYQEMQHGYPNANFSPDTSSISDDTTAAAVPENSEYIVWLYSTNDYSNQANILMEQRAKIPSKPYLPSEVIDSLFPTLTFPTTNDMSTLSIGGDVTLTWTNHAACKVSSAWLSWCDGGAFGGTCVDMNKSGLTGSSTTFDTSSNNITPNWARAEIQCTDALGRKRWIDWYLD